MQLLKSEILITSQPLKDDAFTILLAWLNRVEQIQFTFLECQMTFYMIKQNGMIREGKTYIHYTFDWDGEAWYMNVSGYFDSICKKYSIYPKYLNIGTTS